MPGRALMRSGSLESCDGTPPMSSSLPVILVVDDDAALRQTIVSLLKGEGMQSHAAASVDEALDLARGTELAVVLSDIQMPGRDGLELLGQLRQVQPDAL